MKKIILFNHKGGVSKTTSTYNLGWKLGELGHKVLFVDADPQCNLTAMFMGKDNYEDYYENPVTCDNNLKSGVADAFISSLKPISAMKCVTSKRNANVYLIPGHVGLSEYEAQLNFALTTASSITTLQGLPGSFNSLIEKTAKSIGAEYVFIDVNPGLSAINQTLFLSSDAFIIPTTPDLFSLLAIKSLTMVLPRWLSWKRNNFNLFRDSAYPMPNGTPKFIGIITQRFNVRNGDPTKAFKDKIAEIAQYVKKEFLPVIQNNGMSFDMQKYKEVGIPDNFIIGEIKDFLTLGPKSSEVNVPVFALTDDEIGSVGQVLTTQKNNRDEFSEKYNDLANKIINILQ